MISLCIPTNGIIEWLFPVLDSIYQQNVDERLYEVIVVDNGTNELFAQKMDEYKCNHLNLRYERIQSPIFMNEIETYRRAKGEFIKFVNHRTLLLPGTLQRWIDFVNENREKKPIVYFTNGVLQKAQSAFCLDSFDEFIRELSYWSSWSTGMAFWKSDFERISENGVFNELFPHTAILFGEAKRGCYIIDNDVYLQEINGDLRKKGNYDLFYAFAVEYVDLILELYRQNKISIETFCSVKNSNFQFVCDLFEQFVVDGIECSYDVSGFEKNIEVFYSLTNVQNALEEKRQRYERDLLYAMDNARNIRESIILFGAGEIAQKIIKQGEIQNIAFIVDNDKKKVGKLFWGIPIVSLDFILENGFNNDIVICVKGGGKYEVKEQLESQGIIKYSFYSESKGENKIRG